MVDPAARGLVEDLAQVDEIEAGLVQLPHRVAVALQADLPLPCG